MAAPHTWSGGIPNKSNMGIDIAHQIGSIVSTNPKDTQMQVRDLIKSLADWSPDTEIILTVVGGHYMESEEYEIHSIDPEPDNFDRLNITITPAEVQ